MRSTASRSCAPQSQRWLPNTSPVRHSLCGRISGGGPASPGRRRWPARPARRRGAPGRRRGRRSCGHRASAAYPSANRSGIGTWVRIVAVGQCAAASARLSRPEPRREGVAQQHHVADLADVGERCPAAGVPGEDAVPHEPRRLGVADEHRRDDELQLVDEVVGQELRVHLAAALDHQPLHAAIARGPSLSRAHLHGVAAVDDGRDRAEPLAGVAHARARAVDELLGVAGGEEVGARVELRPPRHGDLHRRRAPARGPSAPRGGSASAPAAAGCRSARSSRRPGSRRRRRGRRRPGRSRRRWTAAGATPRRRCSRRSRRCSSAGCTGAHASAAPSGWPDAPARAAGQPRCQRGRARPAGSRRAP